MIGCIMFHPIVVSIATYRSLSSLPLSFMPLDWSVVASSTVLVFLVWTLGSICCCSVWSLVPASIFFMVFLDSLSYSLTGDSIKLGNSLFFPFEFGFWIEIMLTASWCTYSTSRDCDFCGMDCVPEVFFAEWLLDILKPFLQHGQSKFSHSSRVSEVRTTKKTKMKNPWNELKKTKINWRAKAASRLVRTPTNVNIEKIHVSPRRNVIPERAIVNLQASMGDKWWLGLSGCNLLWRCTEFFIIV